ncbi:MAG: VCBS repeat-containing protein [Planctomycetes bacterium]|nr:VCBS repeat-containing protein [Planctomycetota bacterium]
MNMPDDRSCADWIGKPIRQAAFLLICFALPVPISAAAQPAGPVKFRRHLIDDAPPRQPYYKMVGDVNLDGHADIVVSGRAGPLVMYAGPKWEKTTIATEGYNGGVNGELADIDHDGDLDIVMGGVVWFRNPQRGGGQWEPQRIDTQNIHDVEVADLNGDGRLDVVCRDQSAFGRRGNEIFIYYQEGQTSWRKEVQSCPHGEGLKVADIDADGRAEIVIGGIWHRNDAGKWTPYTFAPDWTEPDTKVEVGDINGDGRPDVVLTPAELKGQQYKISWFESPEGDKSATWREHVIVPDIECVIHSLGLGDFNQDGRLDMAFAKMHQGQPPNEVCVMINVDGGGRWEKNVIGTAGSHDIVVADLDADGDLDIVGANHAVVHPLEMWENLHVSAAAPQQPSSKLDSWVRHVVDADRPARAVFILPGDLDGDNHPDIVTGGVWYKNPGPASGTWQRAVIGPPLNNLATLYDFDGDGDLDVLGTEGGRQLGPGEGNVFHWARNDGSGHFTILNNIEPAVGDFLQGVSVARRSRAGPLEVGLSWHNGTGKGVQMLTVPQSPATDPWRWRRISTEDQEESLSAGDIDRDGDLDLLLGTKWLRNDGASWSMHTLGGSFQPDRSRLVDINRDGRLDVVVGEKNISLPGKVFWYEQPESATSRWIEHVIAEVVGPLSLDVADMDGDGDLDVVVGEHNLKQPATAKLFVFENQDGGKTWLPHHIHTGDEHHDGTIAVDIDLDGDLDIISIGWGHNQVLLYENTAGR